MGHDEVAQVLYGRPWNDFSLADTSSAHRLHPSSNFPHRPFQRIEIRIACTVAVMETSQIDYRRVARIVRSQADFAAVWVCAFKMIQENRLRPSGVRMLLE
jgi:hypothetical protein